MGRPGGGWQRDYLNSRKWRPRVGIVEAEKGGVFASQPVSALVPEMVPEFGLEIGRGFVATKTSGTQMGVAGGVEVGGGSLRSPPLVGFLVAP